MEDSLKNSGVITQLASNTAKLFPLAIALLLAKLLLTVDLSTQECVLYVVTILGFVAIFAIREFIKAKQLYKAEIDELKEDMQELKNQMNAFQLRYGFEGRIP